MTSKIFSALVYMLFTIGISAQSNIDQVLRKYKNDEGVMNMNFTGDVLKVLKSSDSKLKSTVDIVDVLVFKMKDDINQTDKQKIETFLAKEKYDLLINIRNKDQKVKLYAIDSGQYLNKIYAHVNSPDMNAYFIMSGKIIFEELAKLGMDFNGENPMKILEN
ncbi:MAG: DUF4252 domain-containing protein [Saprospiraceae bacterium]|nr:DUF4252 domain-containing protein [Saprospiraceae bacterium]